MEHTEETHMNKKEKTVPITIRISETFLEEVTEMAKFFGVTRNRLLATLLESGKVIADSLDLSQAEIRGFEKGLDDGK